MEVWGGELRILKECEEGGMMKEVEEGGKGMVLKEGGRGMEGVGGELGGGEEERALEVPEPTLKTVERDGVRGRQPPPRIPAGRQLPSVFKHRLFAQACTLSVHWHPRSSLPQQTPIMRTWQDLTLLAIIWHPPAARR